MKRQKADTRAACRKCRNYHTVLGKIERGKANTTLIMLDKIADILSCSPNDLIFSKTPLDTIAASMSASGFPVHGQPCISYILKKWMSPKLQWIPTENKQLSILYRSNYKTHFDKNQHKSDKRYKKWNKMQFIKIHCIFILLIIHVHAENVNNFSDERSKFVDGRS